MRELHNSSASICNGLNFFAADYSPQWSFLSLLFIQKTCINHLFLLPTTSSHQNRSVSCILQRVPRVYHTPTASLFTKHSSSSLLLMNISQKTYVYAFLSTQVVNSRKHKLRAARKQQNLKSTSLFSPLSASSIVQEPSF